MGRTHDFHCPSCHTWTNGFLVPDDLKCEDCGTRMFYDLNLDGCEGVERCWEDDDD